MLPIPIRWLCLSALLCILIAVPCRAQEGAQESTDVPQQVPPTEGGGAVLQPVSPGETAAEAVDEEIVEGTAEEAGEDDGVEVRSRQAIRFEYDQLPALPLKLRGAFFGAHGGNLFVAGGLTGEGEGEGNQATVSSDIFVLRRPTVEGDAASWERVGQLETPRAFGGVASAADGLYLVGGEVDGQPVPTVTRLAWDGTSLTQQSLPDLPQPVSRAAATWLGGTLYVAGGRGADGQPMRQFTAYNPTDETPAWRTDLDAWEGSPVSSPTMIAALEHLYLFGGRASGDEPAPATWRWGPRSGWVQLSSPDRWPAGARAAPVGPSHVFIFGGTNDDGTPSQEILAYHTITDRWFTAGRLAQPLSGQIEAASMGKQIALLSDAGSLLVEPLPIKPYFPWVDYAVVILYLVGMIAMGWYFVHRERSTEDYFRGGRRVPWWATGMSLFATGASAISLMAMPGKSYATNWNYFAISIFSLLVLPVSMFVLAPLVRRLNIATANEYLERRFGVVARLFASVVFMFTQTTTRFAAIMLLPALAFNAITGVPVIWGILLMGLVTTIYTYLGGLAAVIWTDTVQGFVMCAAVAGCLILAITRIDGGFFTAVDTSWGLGKLEVFDLSPSLLHVTSLAFLINTVVATLGGISDQNYVQRVQATPTLGDAQRAVATQLAVAVPINVLLFGLGTALFLFYRSRPEQLNPVMETDGVFPFFVAQQLPVGLSGLVMAALLAATMSTVSSAICSVSDLGVNDFYRRFSRRATDRSALILGRILMGVVGALGTGIAILLSTLGSASVWDLALMLTGLISNGIIGLFWLGLLTRRANEPGALVGVVAGMATVLWLQTSTSVTFLVYQAAGATVAITVGYVASLLIPLAPRDVSGLTLFTLGRADANSGVRPRAGAKGFGS